MSKLPSCDIEQIFQHYSAKIRKITTILTYLSYSVSLDESRNPLENENETKQK